MDQAAELAQKEIKACYMNVDGQAGVSFNVEPDNSDNRDEDEQGQIETNVSIEDIRKGMYNLIYAHPESLLCSVGKSLLRTIREKVCAIAVDEAHIVLE
jgi:superfamily II DNA helicase RecQ